MSVGYGAHASSSKASSRSLCPTRNERILATCSLLKLHRGAAAGSSVGRYGTALGPAEPRSGGLRRRDPQSHRRGAVLPRPWAGRVSPETQQGPSSPTGHRSRSSACAFRGRACVRARERSAPRVRDTGGQVARIIVLGAALAVAGVTLRSDTTAKSTITISQLKSKISALLRRTCAPHAGSPAPTSPSMKLPRVVHSVTAPRRVVSVTHVEYRLYPGVSGLSFDFGGGEKEHKLQPKPIFRSRKPEYSQSIVRIL